MIELGALLLAALAIGIYALADRADDAPGAMPFTSADPRCAKTARRLADARAAMVARGTRLLLVDRPPWASETPRGNVVPLRRT